MRIAGSVLIAAERKRVWDALQDPVVLVRTIPGCERLEEIGDDVYKMTVAAGVASMKGVYQGEVTLAEHEELERYVLRARGQGAPGTVEATVEVRLGDAEGGGTRVDYDAEAVVGGMIGGVGQRMLASVAKKTAGEFFSAVERHLSGVSSDAAAATGSVTDSAAAAAGTSAIAVPAQASHAVVPAVSAEPRVFTKEVTGEVRPAKPGVPPWALLAAFGAGAGVALGSAVIGWVLGRAGRPGR
jgi:carbon monoxide dehydrogenase subunit G